MYDRMGLETPVCYFSVISEIKVQEKQPELFFELLLFLSIPELKYYRVFHYIQKIRVKVGRTVME